MREITTTEICYTKECDQRRSSNSFRVKDITDLKPLLDKIDLVCPFCEKPTHYTISVVPLNEEGQYIKN